MKIIRCCKNCKHCTTFYDGVASPPWCEASGFQIDDDEEERDCDDFQPKGGGA